MNQSSLSSRAELVWNRLAGLFGADALKRKYGPTPPDEWKAMLHRLNQFELDRGLRRLAYSGREVVPTLPVFLKLCRMVGSDEQDEGDKPAVKGYIDKWIGDRWDISANGHLLKHITDQACKGIHYSVPYGNQTHLSPNSPVHPETQRMTSLLVAYKNAWATDMREWGSEPSLADQRRCWKECMDRAERDIRAEA